MRSYKFNPLSLITALFLLFFQINSQAQESITTLSLRTGMLLETFPDVERTDLEVALKYWTVELSQETGIPANIHIYTDTTEMLLGFENGEINFIVSSPLVFINYFDLQQLTDGYKVYAEGSDTEDLLVITHKDSHINSSKDFKNKRLSMLLHDQVCALYINTLTLEHLNRKAKQVFKSINHLYKSPQLIYQLFFKQTDVILVYRRAYELAIELNPQIRKKTQIIHKLPSMVRGIGYFNTNVDPDFREQVLSNLVDIHHSPSGQQLLNIFFAEQLKRSSLADLDNTIKLKQEYKRLINFNKLH